MEVDSWGCESCQMQVWPRVREREGRKEDYGEAL